ATKAGRQTPPLVVHVPIAVNTDREFVRDLARQQLGRYASVPFYRAMFERAGFPMGDPAAPDAYPDALLDDLVVSGTAEEVTAGLRRYLDAGAAEVLAAPLLERDDRDGSIARAFEAVANV
ncbi:MAG: LLM class flavin-dependent oxidoreductase, partial [Dehalococcoidia bacterium]|nr:LLM class flavin-dependent oxidoreductase [Dehalococcoidia bacterium]